MFNRNFGSSLLVCNSFSCSAIAVLLVFFSHFISIGKVGDAMGVVDVTGVLLCELVSNDNGDASFAGVSFLSLSLIDCDRANVLSSLATVLCSSSISVEMLSGSEMIVEKERVRKTNIKIEHLTLFTVFYTIYAMLHYRFYYFLKRLWKP